jgi:pilus assembly protein CpaF
LTPTVAHAIDLVVHIGFDELGHRRILQLVSVSDRYEGSVIEIEPVFTWNGLEYKKGLATWT